ncbi:LacI family DNA-binding transcriptional regulator [Butyrivibrio sp. NC3005]|uniref:LacI family DNA-binding transcriptional regulator n=1 Tax=Butyrivibrio sp. NC3005 TaxID=1280685 RepID=UPI0004043B04|nr:LacI family DNA-binding transcriptional regulator [Butyrivibrio sp. NC3005]
MAVTIYDIARLSGVSIATISRVVNGNPNVSDKTRERVLSIMKEYDYTPNPFARSLQFNSMKMVGISCSDISDDYMANMVSIIEKRLHEYGYDYMLFCSGYDLNSREHAVNLLLKKKMDALILIGSQFLGNGQEEEVSYLHKVAKNVPIFIINGALEDPNIYSVIADDYKSMYDAAKKLIESGRRKILFLYDSDSVSSMQKMGGYEKALKEAGIPIDGNLKIKITCKVHEERDLLLLRKDLEFDAVLTTTDKLAIGVIKYAKAKKLDIPKDISVVGYNNSYLSEYIEPELTSVDPSAKKMAKTVVDNIMKLLKGDEIEHRITVEGNLIKRCTTDF